MCELCWLNFCRTTTTMFAELEFGLHRLVCKPQRTRKKNGVLDNRTHTAHSHMYITHMRAFERNLSSSTRRYEPNYFDIRSTMWVREHQTRQACATGAKSKSMELFQNSVLRFAACVCVCPPCRLCPSADVQYTFLSHTGDACECVVFADCRVGSIRLISLRFQFAADFGSEIGARATNCACDYIRLAGHTETRHAHVP